MYRNRAGLFQREVAQALKLDCTDRLSKWEVGHATPSIINLFRLAIIYKASPQELYPELWKTIKNQIEENRKPAQTSPDNKYTDMVNLIDSRLCA